MLGALSLLLNGGGVAQLKTITQELNLALEGREDSARSVLRQLRVFTGQLDENKEDIVDAIESLNRLAIAAEKQLPTIDKALEELPSALDSIDRQRDDLVEMLTALDQLSSVAVDVIAASKDSTITSLQRLDPVLTQLAASGDDFTNAFHVFLTYPFVDEVGRPGPAGRPQPAHGRLHQPLDHPRRRRRGRCERDPVAADQPAHRDRPDRHRQRRPGLPPERLADQRGLQAGAGQPRRS